MKNCDAKLLKEWSDIPEFESIIHKCPKMSELLNDAYTIAKHDDVPVLILGETGTGKELFARAIHKSSRRAGKKMESVNCASIQDTLANATLFGWSKGAWTGAPPGEGQGTFLKCSGSTIFFDEIGELSLENQTRLLRVLEDGLVQRVGDGKTIETDVRIIAATNRDLRKMIDEGKF